MPEQVAKELALAHRLTRGCYYRRAESSQMCAEGTCYDEAEAMLT
jgi:hypothetical protein